METLKEYHYTYYSYEEWGRGYFGSRTCKCLPEKDVKYFGSFYDKTFKPTRKIILKSDYATRVEAIADEIILHDYYDVANNPHFANQAKQTSTKFYYIIPFEEASKRGKINGLNHKQNKTGVCGRSKEKIIEDAGNAGKVGGKKTYELGIGIHAITPEQRTKNSKKAYANGLGKMSKEEKSEVSKKGGNKAYELGVGVHSLTKEDKIEIGKKAYANGLGKISKEDKIEIGKKAYANGLGKMSKEERIKNCKIVSSQKWMCLETGYISNPGGLARYQTKRGIDTSKRKRIE